MNTLGVLLQAQGAGGSGMSMLVMIVLMIGVMYFFMIRPQQKQQKKERQFRAGLQIGDSVITQGGLYGKVKEIGDDTLALEVAHNVIVKVNKNFVYPDSSNMKVEEKK